MVALLCVDDVCGQQPLTLTMSHGSSLSGKATLGPTERRIAEKKVTAMILDSGFAGTFLFCNDKAVLQKCLIAIIINIPLSPSRYSYGCHVKSVVRRLGITLVLV